jgi:preprotein translocase subunit Sss1
VVDDKPDEILEELKSMNAKLDVIIGILSKPERSVKSRVFEIVGTGVSILGILGIIDIIRNWIIGG